MKNFLKHFFHPKGEINYFYFSFFLLFITLLSLSHFLSWEQPYFGIFLFFLLYAIGQAFLEVCFFILIAYSLKRWASRWAYLLFIGFSFVLLLIHYTHYTMVRLMDASIGYVFKFLFGSGIRHFIAGLQALNMNVTMIAIIIGSFLLIPLTGVGFYWLTFRASQRKPLFLSLKQIAMGLTTIGLSLFLLDLIALPFLNRALYTKYQKTLPLGITFLSPPPNEISLPGPLIAVRNEKETIQNIPSIYLPHHPNIYIFIIETFRRDFLTSETAPNLISFAENNIQFPHSFSNSNATHLSWFSIFHSDIPFHWTAMRDQWREGSIPLQFLKKLGYQIHVYSSADLHYFNMDQILFGRDRQLADKIVEFSNQPLEPCDRDALCLEALKQDLAKEGHVYLIFFDSTHSEYSSPRDFPLAFEPITKEIDYLTIGPKSPELEFIKNRYRNSIHYVDHLMGRFFDLLQENKIYNDSIIAITGDHGEEFFEEGALFHGTHLNFYQTNVPIFLKFPIHLSPQTKTATHLDMLPSILHYLTGQSTFHSLFDGQSLFAPNRWPYRIAILQNGPDTPTEFSIENEDLKLHAKIVDSLKLEILELQGSLHPNVFTPLLHAKEDLLQRVN